MGPGSKTSGGGVALRDVRWRRRAGCLRAPLFVPLALTMMFAAAAPAAGRPAWQWPVDGQVLTPYRNDNAEPYAAGMHRGIDIRAAAGTPVLAATGGAVTFAGGLGSSGNVVAVASGDGRTTATYLHLAATAVKEGQAISAGQRIGTVGTTGRRSVPEPHLHFGVHSSADPDYYFDPLDFLGHGSQASAGAGPAKPPPAAASLQASPALAGVRPGIAEAEQVGADAIAQRGPHTWHKHEAGGRAQSSPIRRAATTPRGIDARATKRARSHATQRRVPEPIESGAGRAPRSIEGSAVDAPRGSRIGPTHRTTQRDGSGFGAWAYGAALALLVAAVAIPRRKRERTIHRAAVPPPALPGYSEPPNAGREERGEAGHWEAEPSRSLRAVSG